MNLRRGSAQAKTGNLPENIGKKTGNSTMTLLSPHPQKQEKCQEKKMGMSLIFQHLNPQVDDNKKRHSLSYQRSPITVSLQVPAKESQLKPKKNMRELVDKIMTDEEYIRKEYPGFKLERILQPGDSYGEVGMEFMSKRFNNSLTSSPKMQIY